MGQNKNEKGFTLIETTIALMILLVGILACVSALSFGMFSMQESEKRSLSKEIARSTMETIFSIRDMLAFDPQSGGATYNWNAIQIKNGNNGGIFLDGWNPIRESPGTDGIYGTDDDSCAEGSSCVVGSTTNSSAVTNGYVRKIEISDIVETGAIKKRLITIRVRYYVGLLQREEVESTIVANMPLN